MVVFSPRVTVRDKQSHPQGGAIEDMHLRTEVGGLYPLQPGELVHALVECDGLLARSTHLAHANEPGADRGSVQTGGACAHKPANELHMTR